MYTFKDKKAREAIEQLREWCGFDTTDWEQDFFKFFKEREIKTIAQILKETHGRLALLEKQLGLVYKPREVEKVKRPARYELTISCVPASADHVLKAVKVKKKRGRPKKDLTP